MINGKTGLELKVSTSITAVPTVKTATLPEYHASDILAKYSGIIRITEQQRDIKHETTHYIKIRSTRSMQASRIKAR